MKTKYKNKSFVCSPNSSDWEKNEIKWKMSFNWLWVREPTVYHWVVMLENIGKKLSWETFTKVSVRHKTNS